MRAYITEGRSFPGRAVSLSDQAAEGGEGAEDGWRDGEGHGG